MYGMAYRMAQLPMTLSELKVTFVIPITQKI